MKFLLLKTQQNQIFIHPKKRRHHVSITRDNICVFICCSSIDAKALYIIYDMMIKKRKM